MSRTEPNARIIYADIIDLPHHQSTKRPHMSLYNRAAQFAPFAALSGYDDMIAEEARLTDSMIEADLEKLNMKLQLISHETDKKKHPTITLTVFVPDKYKDGGEYITVTGEVKKIDPVAQAVVLRNRAPIQIANIYDIQGELFEGLDAEVI